MAEAAKTKSLSDPFKQTDAQGNIIEDWAARDLAIHREGTKIVLPSDPVDMSYGSARAILKRAEDAENMVYDISETIPVHFFDGLVALYNVLRDKYGYAGTQTKIIKGWFGDIKIPPKLIHVKVGKEGKR